MARCVTTQTNVLLRERASFGNFCPVVADFQKYQDIVTKSWLPFLLSLGQGGRRFFSNSNQVVVEALCKSEIPRNATFQANCSVHSSLQPVICHALVPLAAR
jgi:hypothetical protein